MPIELSQATVVCCESDGRFAAALRRELAFAGLDSQFELRETRSSAHCLQALTEAGGRGLVAIYLSPTTADAVCQLLDALDRRSGTWSIVLADPNCAVLESLMRALGAQWFGCTTTQLRDVVPLVQRYGIQAKRPTEGPLESIRNRLPWRDTSDEAPPVNA